MGVLGASSQEVVWAIVRDLATQYWKFEKDEENEEADAVMPPTQSNVHEQGWL